MASLDDSGLNAAEASRRTAALQAFCSASRRTLLVACCSRSSGQRVGARRQKEFAMRSKLGLGLLGIAVTFLLATNPVVVEAAGQITGAQIKNETIKSKDIKNNQVKSVDVKNGSLTKDDLMAGTVPGESIKSVNRFLGGGGNIPESATLGFYGTTTTVSVDGNDVLIASGSLDYFSDTAGQDFEFSLCARPVGIIDPPSPIGGAAALSGDIDTPVGDGSVSRHVSGVLPAGSYTVGMCARAFNSNTDVIESFGSPGGWVMVIDGSGPLGRVGPTAPSKTHSEG